MPSMPGVFLPAGARSHRERRQETDKRRGSARERGYTSRWDKAAAAFKRRNPLCLGCHAVGRVTAAAVVDHVEPHRGDDARFWDPDNWQPACAWHHDAIKQRLEAMHDAGAIDAGELRLDSATARRLTVELGGLAFGALGK